MEKGRESPRPLRVCERACPHIQRRATLPTPSDSPRQMWVSTRGTWGQIKYQASLLDFSQHRCTGYPMCGPVGTHIFRGH